MANWSFTRDTQPPSSEKVRTVYVWTSDDVKPRSTMRANEVPAYLGTDGIYYPTDQQIDDFGWQGCMELSKLDDATAAAQGAYAALKGKSGAPTTTPVTPITMTPEQKAASDASVALSLAKQDRDKKFYALSQDQILVDAGQLAKDDPDYQAKVQALSDARSVAIDAEAALTVAKAAESAVQAQPAPGADVKPGP